MRIEQIHAYRNDREHAASYIGEGGLAPLAKLTDLAAQSDAPLLITGETGTGKNVLAQHIHDRSQFRQAPCIAINCAALPENLIESELFGYEKGAFTGASTSRKGIFEMAEGGTLVLDEIAEIPPNLQAKLLGVLDSKRIKKIGDDVLRPVNVRIMAITNQDMDVAIRMKTFRADLYYRLSVVHLHVPPLRDRRQDIPALCHHLLKKITPASLQISDGEMKELMDYPWPGNIRELKNILERAVLLREGPHLLPVALLGKKNCPTGLPSKYLPTPDAFIPLGELEKAYIHRVLNEGKGNYRETARLLGISLSTLKRRIKEHSISRKSSS